MASQAVALPASQEGSHSGRATLQIVPTPLSDLTPPMLSDLFVDEAIVAVVAKQKRARPEA